MLLRLYERECRKCKQSGFGLHANERASLLGGVGVEHADQQSLRHASLLGGLDCVLYSFVQVMRGLVHFSAYRLLAVDPAYLWLGHRPVILLVVRRRVAR